MHFVSSLLPLREDLADQKDKIKLNFIISHLSSVLGVLIGWNKTFVSGVFAKRAAQYETFEKKRKGRPVLAGCDDEVASPADQEEIVCAGIVGRMEARAGRPFRIFEARS